MKKSVLNKALQAFEQKDQSFSRRHGGLGVGLTLTDSLVRILAGKLRIESIWGRGTEAWIEIPVTLCEASDTPTTQPQVFAKRLSALVVEDNPVNQQVLKAMLGKLNFDVVCADQGESALEIYSDSGKHFDVIFMDCQMPIMDGFEASRSIRKSETSSPIPIIAVTANAMSGDREKCLAAGMSDYLAKPVTIKQLHQTIAKYFHND